MDLPKNLRCAERISTTLKKNILEKSDLGIAHKISLLFYQMTYSLNRFPVSISINFSCFVFLMISIFTITSIWADNRTLCGGGGWGQNGKPWNWLTAGLHFQIVTIARQKVSSLPICSFKLFTFSEELELLLWGDIQKESIYKKTLPKAQWTQALTTLTHSTPLVQSRSFNKLWNLGQTSVWFCLARGEKYVEQLWQIHVTTLTNPCSNS